jgi:hypothetical protein
MRAAATLLASAILFASISGPAFAVHSDLTSSRGISIGATLVPWGGSIVLDESDALFRANGRCAFRISYDVTNTGHRPTGPFKNFLTTPLNTVAINASAGLAAGETRMVETQSFLVPGTYGLVLRLDAENALTESNEANNGYFIKVELKGQCRSAPPR